MKTGLMTIAIDNWSITNQLSGYQGNKLGSRVARGSDDTSEWKYLFRTEWTSAKFIHLKVLNLSLVIEGYMTCHMVCVT